MSNIEIRWVKRHVKSNELKNILQQRERIEIAPGVLSKTEWGPWEDVPLVMQLKDLDEPENGKDHS